MTVLIVFFLLIILPAAVAFVSEPSRGVFTPGFVIGAPVVYQSDEMSTRPCPGACNIHPSARGEFYYYSLINYLRVTEVLEDGRIIAVTRDRKRFCFWPDNSQLRKARLRERVIHRRLFP